jgi:tetratricopeptide (TPR) repeat protein
VTTAELLALANEAFITAGFCTADFAETRALLRAAREQADREGDRAGAAGAADRLGLVQHYVNITRLMQGREVPEADISTEESLFREALDYREATGDLAGTAQSLFGLGLVFHPLRRDWTSAMPLFRRALDIIEATGDAADLYTRSEIHRHVGFYYSVEDVQPQRAVHHLQRSLELREELGDIRLIPSGLEALGEAELAAGHPRRAVDLLEQAVRTAHRAGLLEERIQSAEQTLGEARATLSAMPR